MKQCKRCGETKPFSEFRKQYKSKDGHEHVCIACNQNKIKHTFVDEVEGKTCTVCKQWKPLIEYGVNRNLSDGLSNLCKECARTKVRRYWAADPVAWAEKNKRSYRKNRSKRKQTSSEYRERNIESVREYDRERSRKRYEENPEQRHSYTHARRAREKQAVGSFKPKEWKALKQKYENKCLCCGKTEPEIKLTPDHVVPISAGGSNDISNIQPLCLPCNLQKATKVIDYRPKE